LVLQLTDSGAALGIVTALQFGPTLLLSLYGGALADRGDKRKLLLATQSGMSLVALLLGILQVSGVVQLWHVMLLAAMLGVVSALDTPIRQSFVVEMVGPADLPNAVALNSMTFNLARILGPAIAGVVIAAFGTGYVFIGNAVSCVAVLAGLVLMRTADLFPAKQVLREPGQLRAALRYVRRRGDLVLPMALVFVVGTFGMNYQISIALLAKQVFHRGADAYGVLSMTLAIGATLGAFMGTLRRRRPTRLFVVMAAFAFGLCEIVASLMPTFSLLTVALIPAGFSMIMFAQSANAMVQLGVRPTMRGRVMGLYILCFMGGTPFGAPIVGLIGQLLGPRWSMLGGGLISSGTALATIVFLARRRRVGLKELRIRFQVARP
jgi:MFS family permease